jgi:hypothetical protein
VPDDAAVDDSKEVEGGDAKDDEEKVSDLVTSPRQRQHSSSISQQSKMRSSSFRSTSGPLSPRDFPPEENTAPDIYLKQTVRIEELEKENKRLAKEASDGERRWKKAEEELEDLREAEEAERESGAKAKDTSATTGLSGQLEKLVRLVFSLILVVTLTASLEKRNCCTPAPELSTPSPGFAYLSSRLVPIHVANSASKYRGRPAVEELYN